MEPETNADDPAESPYGVAPPRRPGAEPRTRGHPAPAFPFSAVRYWAPGALLALAVAVSLGIAYVLIRVAAATDAVGLGVIWVAPGAVGCVLGCVLGYGVRGRTVWLAYAGIYALGSLTWTVAASSGVGVFCGTILALLGVPGLALGQCLGVQLGHKMKDRSAWYRRFLPGLLLAALGTLGIAAQSAFQPPADEETVVTEAVVDAPIEFVWSARVFGDDTTMAPASSLRHLGLPSPRGNDGSLTYVGDEKTCRLGDGVLSLLVVEADAPTTLAFIVTEQRGFEDRNASLRRGRLTLTPLGPLRTRVRLSTTYAPLLRDRLLWRPIERLVAHEIHRHVVRELQRVTSAQQVSTSTTSRGQFQRSGIVSPTPRETTIVDPPDSKRSPFQR